MIFARFLKKEERRRNVRLNDCAEINHQIANEQYRPNCRNKDICEDGISFYLKEHLKPGTLLKLWIYLPGSREPVFAVGKIIWQKKALSATEFLFAAGLEFKMIEEATRHRLSDYLDNVYHNKK